MDLGGGSTDFILALSTGTSPVQPLLTLGAHLGVHVTKLLFYSSAIAYSATYFCKVLLVMCIRKCSQQ